MSTEQSSLVKVGQVRSEREVGVPRRVMREDMTDKGIAGQDMIHREHMMEEYSTVKPRIVEVAKPVIRERIVEGWFL